VDGDVALVQLLDRTLRDEAFWRLIASPDRRASTELAGRAVSIYQRTWPLVTAMQDAEDEQPMYHALAVVRDIAAIAAASSYPWTDAELAEYEVHISTRAIIELSIRLYNVDDWAAGLGHPLELVHATSVPEEAWLSQPGPVEDYESGVAEQICGLLRLYGDILDLGEIPPSLSRDDALRWSCALVSVTRGMLVYSRSRVPIEAQAVFAANVFVADALFVATTEMVPIDELFPTEDDLRWLIGPAGCEWLQTHGAEPPDWLA
jgi:hypothetical protein